jgi:cell division control protein 6
MQSMAIELAARKVAGTGDLRKALDVCRLAIASVEGDEYPQVSIKHILKATSTLLGSSNKSRIETLNSLAKIVLAVIALLYEDSSKISDMPAADLYMKYRNVSNY